MKMVPLDIPAFNVQLAGIPTFEFAPVTITMYPFGNEYLESMPPEMECQKSSHEEIERQLNFLYKAVTNGVTHFRNLNILTSTLNEGICQWAAYYKDKDGLRLLGAPYETSLRIIQDFVYGIIGQITDKPGETAYMWEPIAARCPRPASPRELLILTTFMRSSVLEMLRRTIEKYISDNGYELKDW